MAILERFPLGAPPWRTLDPFLFCVHHLDAYPSGDGNFRPNTTLAGRTIGQDFSGKDGWSMYHGRQIPGFPQHPHRGFETVTLARQGFIDHADSLGAKARFGNGDVQWMTAGAGIVHSEMFPLLNTDSDNPAELFQIWLNLPAHDKLVPPYFTMMWSETLPRLHTTDPSGNDTQITVIAGSVGAQTAPPPPPNSWAARPGSELSILTISLSPGAQWTLPPTIPGANRTLYFFAGDTLSLGGETVTSGTGIRLQPDVPTAIHNGPEPSEVLMLQGVPIREPVANHGPFVMNTREELVTAFSDYQRTQFGGWPWPESGPVHGPDPQRFAIHPDGREDRPTVTSGTDAETQKG